MAIRPGTPNLSGMSPSSKESMMLHYQRRLAEYEQQQAYEDDLRRQKEEAARVKDQRAYQTTTAETQQGYQLAQIAAQKQVTPTTTTSSTSPVMPGWSPPSTYDIPEYQPYIPGAAPTYAAPTWDEGAIESLTQKKAAGGLRDLRQQVQRVTGRKFDNVQAGRMTLREALQGYGSGIGSVLSGAGNVARGEYGQKYGIEADVAKTNYGGRMAQWQGETAARSQGALTNYQSELERRRTGFQSAWDKWKASIGTTTTSTTR